MNGSEDDAVVPQWSTWQVGERVVVRYRRGAPSGEPALTDALGDVVDVGPQGVTVRTRRGDVAIAAEAIVLGRRVPPPPGPRRRPTT